MDIKQYILILYYKKYIWLIFFTLIATLIIDTLRYLGVVRALGFEYSTYISALLMYMSLAIIAFVAFKTSLYNESSAAKTIFILWLFWNIFNIIRGAFLAGDYWEWKFLLFTSVGFSLITIVFLVGNNLLFARGILNFYLKWVFTFGFLAIPLSLVTNDQLYSRLMIPIGIFILFIPYLQYKWKILIIIVAITSILLVIDFRTNIIKIVFSGLLLFLFYFKNLISQSWIRLAHFVLFFGPIVFFALAAFGSFSLFSELSTKNEYVVTDSQGDEENLTSDTRTFLYEEVMQSMNNTTEWLIGKSASGSYSSQWFYNTGGAMEGKRFRSEVNILNILLYHGIIGVIIYFLLLYRVSFLAIQNSNNILSKMLGLVIASRWTLSFIEEYTQYDLNFFFFWLIMGLVSTAAFRKLNDEEVQSFFKFS